MKPRPCLFASSQKGTCLLNGFSVKPDMQTGALHIQIYIQMTQLMGADSFTNRSHTNKNPKTTKKTQRKQQQQSKSWSSKSTLSCKGWKWQVWLLHT